MSADATDAGTDDGDTGGYVHRPGRDNDPDTERDEAGANDADGFGRRGWLLVGVVVLSTLVIPGVIYLFPAAPARTGLPFLAAMLALPMVPAVLLGATAVWSMTAATGSSDHDGE